MTSFIQQYWFVIIFGVAMVAMHLRHGGQRGGQHGGGGGCGGGHSSHEDTSASGEPRSQSDNRTGSDPTPRASTPQDSAPPRDAKPPLAAPGHHH